MQIGLRVDNRFGWFRRAQTGGTAEQLVFIKLLIGFAIAKQLIVTSLADDLAALHHDDLVGTLDGAESMRDDESRALVKYAFDRPLDQCFTLGIHLAGGLVENQDRRSTKNRAGDADTLLLAARKLRAEAAQ